MLSATFHKRVLLGSLLLATLLPLPLEADDPKASDPKASDPPIPADARLQVEGRVAFTEGPVWHPTGNVYFSDIVNNRIMRRDRKGEMHVFRRPSGRTNGMLFDLQGRLVCCEGGGPESRRRVTRTEADGTITVLADDYEGKAFNSPNDLTIDSQGRIYFTDPRYGSREGIEQFDAEGREIEGVYRIDAPGRVTRILTHEVDRPNGIAVSAGDRYLYVADNVNDGPRGMGGNRKLWRFDLRDDGTVDPESRQLLMDWGSDRGPDGMALDQAGRLYVAAGFNYPQPPVETARRYKAGIYVISPQGELEQFIPVPADMVTNCAFGDDDLKTLYITAGHKLWSIRTNTPGQVAWPPNPEQAPNPQQATKPQPAENSARESASGKQAGQSAAAGGREPIELAVWPGDVPGEDGSLGEEKTLPSQGGKPIIRLTNVSQPSLHVYRAPADKNTGAAVLICPGGGYHILAWDLEGTEVAEWLNSIGVNAIVLKYRVPRRQERPKHEAPLQDAQRAMSLVRSNAEQWGIDPDRIGILGFSAGGHLAATTATQGERRAYEAVDDVDRVRCRPDFAVLVYPAYLIDEENPAKLAPEIDVNDQTPPVFFAHAGNDRIGPQNSIRMYLALKQADVPAELHVYTSGGHGFGLRPTDSPSSTWPESCARWLRDMDLLQATNR